MADNQIKIDLLVKTSEAVTSIKAQKLAVRELLEEMGKLQEGSDGFNKLAKAAGELQDRMSDTRAQAKFFADDMKNLSGITAIGQGIAGGFAVLQGTMGLVSGESEELQKAMQKVQITMGIIQGLQQVSLLFNKDETASIFLKNIANKLFNRTKVEQVVVETAATTATVASTVATNAETVAVGKATIATRIWNTVLKANPLVLLISVLAAVAAGVYYFTKATNNSKAANDALNKTLEYQNELYRISRQRQEADADARIKLAESTGASEKELLALELKKSTDEEANDKASLARLQSTIDKKRKLRMQAIFDGEDDLSTSINDEIKTLQKEADVIDENFMFRAGVGNKYYVDRKALQNKYDAQAKKDTDEANKKASDAQIKSQSDLLAKKKEFAAKMLEVDTFIKSQQAAIEDAKILNMENTITKELSLLDNEKEDKINSLNDEATKEIEIVRKSLEDRWGLNTKYYNQYLTEAQGVGGRIYTIQQQQAQNINQLDIFYANKRKETLRKLEEERLQTLRETTKAIISPEEFTRYTEYLTQQINTIVTTVDGVKKTVKIFPTGGLLSQDDIDSTKDKINGLKENLDFYQKMLENVKKGAQLFDEGELILPESVGDKISAIGTEISGLEKKLSDDISKKTSPDGFNNLLSDYINSIFKNPENVKGMSDGFVNISNEILQGGTNISSAMDTFKGDVYGKLPQVLTDIFNIDENIGEEGLNKTKEYNIKLAALYLDKYNAINSITKGQSVQSFVTPADNSVSSVSVAKKNTEDLKKVLDDRYATLKKAASQNYEDELFEAFSNYQKGKTNEEEFGKAVEVVKQKHADNMLDIDVTYGVASQETLVNNEQKKLDKLKAAQDKEKAYRQRAVDTWIQTTQNAITSINSILQQGYQQQITNSNLVYDAKKANIDKEIEDYNQSQQHYTIVEQAKIDKLKDFQNQKDVLEKQRLADERKIKVDQFNTQKATDAIQIGISTTVAIMKTIAELGAVGAATPVGIALIAAIAAQGAISAGFVLAQEPAFATGGLVTGPGGPKDDKISARLSNGEAVINAKSTSMYKPILSAINQAGGGVAFPLASGGVVNTPSVTSVSNSGGDMEEFKQLLYDVISRPIETYIKESSVTSAQNSISRQNRRTSF